MSPVPTRIFVVALSILLRLIASRLRSDRRFNGSIALLLYYRSLGRCTSLMLGAEAATCCAPLRNGRNAGTWL